MIGALQLLCASFALGIALAARIAPAWVALVPFGAAAAVASVVCTVKKKPATAALLFLFVVLGMAAHQFAAAGVHAPWAPLLGRETVVSGYVENVLESADNYISFLFRAEEPVRGMARVSVYQPGPNFYPAYGTRVQIAGMLTAPPGRRNPGGFDYGSYLETTGVGALLSVTGRNVAVLSGVGGSPLLYGADRARERAGHVLRQFLPAEEAGLSLGLLLGDRRSVFPETLEAYRRLGIAHLLVVSGLHVGYVAAFAFFLTGLFLRRRNAVLAAALAGAAVFGYVFLTGGQPPVWRAALTLFLGLLARQAGREADGLQALALAALFMLFFRPLWLFSISFQFSFLATAGILFLTPRLEAYLSRLPKPLAALVAVSAGAQLAVLPLQVHYFGLLSLFSIPVNLVCVPLVGLVMALGLAGLLAGLLYLPLAGPFFWTALPLLLFLERVPRAFAAWPAAALWLPAVHPLVWVAYFACLVCFACGLKLRPLSGKKALALLLAVNLLLFSSLPLSGRGLLRVTFLDVGQGMAVHIRTPSGGNLLVDAGGRSGFDTGETILVPYLRSVGVRTLDLVVLTHPHHDHYGGMPTVIGRYPAGGFVSSGAADESGEFAKLQELLDAQALPSYAVEEGYHIRFDGLSLDVLSPPETRFALTGDDANNNSLVLRLAYRDFSLLITGDAEGEAIGHLVQARPGELSVNLLQVPHHGSGGALSPEFLRACGARVAVITVGKNRFGHPHPGTLQLLAEHGLAVYRTDIHGAVSVVSNGSDWSIRTQLAGAE